MGISIQEQEQVVTNLLQDFTVNNMVLFAGIGATEDELTKKLCELPWSCVITTSQDVDFCSHFTGQGRTVKEICGYAELPPRLFNRSELAVIRLFSKKNIEELEEDDEEVLEERIQDECKRMIQAVMAKLEVSCQLVFVGYNPNDSRELKRTVLVVQWEKCQANKTMFFGMDDSTEEGARLKKAAEKRHIQFYEESLSKLLEEYGYEDEDEEPEYLQNERGENIFYKGGKPAYISNEQLLQYRSVGLLLTEEKINEIRPYGKIQQSRWFSNFLTRSAVDGPQWYGYSRNTEFYLKRNFEEILTNLVVNILDGQNMSVNGGYLTPIILNGDPGSSKSVVLGALAYNIYQRRKNPVIFINKKELNTSDDIKELEDMMRAVDDSQTRILIVWDGSAYSKVEEVAKSIARQLDNLGRRFLLVCSAYRYLPLEHAKEEECKRYTYELGKFKKASGNEADVSFFRGCYFVNSTRNISEKDKIELSRKIKTFYPKAWDTIHKRWDKLNSKLESDIFDYFYELIVALQDPLEKGLGQEHRTVSKYVQNQMDKILGEKASDTAGTKVVSPMLQALLDAGVSVENTEVDANDTEDISEKKLERFDKCIALFSRFRLATPVSIALYILNDGKQRENSVYSEKNYKLFNMLTSSIPWIFYRPNEDDEFCFYYRNSREAEIKIKDEPADEVISMICQMLDYYGYMYQEYGSEDISLKKLLQRLIRLIGPNSEYGPFQAERHMEHIRLTEHLNKIVDKIADLREKVGIPDSDVSFASIEVTFLRELHKLPDKSLIQEENYNEEEFLEKLNYHLSQLRRAINLANESMEKLKLRGTNNHEKSLIAAQVNSLTVEICQCNMALSSGLSIRKAICSDISVGTDGGIEPLRYMPMYRMLTESLNSNPLNGYTYNTLFKLFKKEYKVAVEKKDEKRRVELLSQIMMYVEDAYNMWADIHDKGYRPDGEDELTIYLAEIRDYNSDTQVSIRSLDDGTCSEEFIDLFSTLLTNNNASAITFIAQKELQAVGLNGLRKGNGQKDEQKVEELTEEQLKKCKEVYSFLTRSEYEECVNSEPHALYLLLRVAWMCYNKRVLIESGRECGLTYMDYAEWKEILHICERYNEICRNKRPIVVLLNALAKIQCSEDYREAMQLLESLKEESFFTVARMRVPYMICNPDGTTKNYSGRVCDDREKNQVYINVNGVSEYLSREGIRAYLVNIGERSKPEITDYFGNLEMGIGYTGFSLYTAEGRAAKEGFSSHAEGRNSKERR